MSGQTRLIYLANARMPTEKAHGAQIAQMCESFLLAGCDLELWYPDRDEPEEAKSIPLRAYYGLSRDIPTRQIPCLDLMTVLYHAGLRGKLVDKLSFRLRTYSLLAVLAWRAWREHRRAPDTLFYMRDLTLAKGLPRLLPASFRRRMVVEVHALSPDSETRRRQVATLSQVGAVVALTATMKRDMVASGLPEARILVAHDAFNQRLFAAPPSRAEARARLGLPAEGRIAAYVGRYLQLNKEKGIPDIIAAAPAMLAACPDLRFLFVGGPLDRVPHYQGLIAALGLPAERFAFHDKRPMAEVPAWCAAADLLLMPYPQDPQYAANLSPLKMFEYMACHRPILASALPSIGEILQDGTNAALCAPSDPPSLARRAIEVLNTPSLGEKLAERAARDVSTLTWDNRARHILDFIVPHLERT